MASDNKISKISPNYLAGWGVTKPFNATEKKLEYSPVLKEILLEIVSFQLCSEILQEYNIHIHRNQFCAVPAQNNREGVAYVNMFIYFIKVFVSLR